MADNINEYALSNALAPFAEAQLAMANRPQKNYVLTNTSSTSTPYALSDLIAARDSLGTATRNLDEALKQRENFGYTLASALASVPQQEGYGSWLSGLGRSFGTGLSALTNAKIDRAQKVYDAEMKDLANRLAFDKAMGETTTQRQEQKIGYLPSSATGKGAGSDEVVKKIATATGEGTDPEEFIKKYNTGGVAETIASNVDPQENPTLLANLVRNYVAPVNTGARSALAQNLTDKIIGPKIQNMVQTMGGARGGDTIKEVTARVGPLAKLTDLGTQEQLGAIISAKTDVLDIINRDRMAGGLKPLTMEQFQPEWNKLFSGIATYDNQYGQEGKEGKSSVSVEQPAEQEEDYSKYFK